MTVDVVSEIAIELPEAEVAAFAANPDNAPRWYANIKSVEWETAPQVQVGARIAFVADFLGRRLAYTYEIVELDLPNRLVMRAADGPFPMETTYTWDRTESGATRMTLRNRGEPKGFSAVVAPFMASAMRAANRKDLKALKTVLESRV